MNIFKIIALTSNDGVTYGKQYRVTRECECPCGAVWFNDDEGYERGLAAGYYRVSLRSHLRPLRERFADSRADRFAKNPMARKMCREDRRDVARYASAEFKAVREDRRFALPALAGKLWDAGYGCSYIPDSFRFAFDWRQFDAHPQLEGNALQLAAAHPAKCDPAKIACYPTRADAARGREIVMTAGRFFAACFPHLSPKEIQSKAEAYANAQKPPVMHFAESADDWCRVYSTSRGFSSCMAGKWDKDASSNPIRFYAYPGNGLRLAYLTHNGKPDGETVARSIVNVDRMLFVRVYGDARILRALNAAGYSCDADAAFDGVKCNARTNRHGDLIAPYVDGSNTRAQWDGSADYCTLGSYGNFDVQCTDGVATGDYDDEDMMSCDHCGDRMHSDDSNYSSHHECDVCDTCASRHYTRAIVDRRGNRDLIRDDDVIRINREDYLNDSDVLTECGFMQTSDGEWLPEDEVIYLDYCDEYVDVDTCTRLDIAHGDDEWARDCDITTITLHGKDLTVHEDYDGDTDEKRRARASRRVRHYSRAPQRRRASRHAIARSAAR